MVWCCRGCWDRRCRCGRRQSARSTRSPRFCWLRSFWAFVAAGVSDAVDGFIARQFNLRSDLGAYLDPLADKFLLISIYVTLGVIQAFPVWLVIVVVSRDILIVFAFAAAWLIGSPIKIRPLFVSKANTAAQIVLAGVALARLGYGFDFYGLTDFLIYTVASLTVLSLCAYFIEWIRHLAGTPEAHPDGRREDRA